MQDSVKPGQGGPVSDDNWIKQKAVEEDGADVRAWSVQEGQTAEQLDNIASDFAFKAKEYSHDSRWLAHYYRDKIEAYAASRISAALEDDGRFREGLGAENLALTGSDHPALKKGLVNALKQGHKALTARKEGQNG